MDADELYGLPLERFIPERTALAKQLRADGQRDEAATIAALRKPTVAAWAANQLVRTQRKLVTALFEAGDALRKTQDELLAGRGDARTLRQAAERERAGVDKLLERARGLLTGEGEELSPAVLERVSETLHAAALDETAREQLRDGRLERELRHAGLGFGEATPLPPARPRAPKAPKTAKPDRAAERERRAAERAEQERAEQERAAARKAARATQAAARKRAERAARALKTAEERRARAAAALEEADAALAAARDEAAAAARDLD